METWLILYLMIGGAVLTGYLFKTYYDSKLITWKLKNSPKPMPNIYSYIDTKTGEIKYHIIGKEEE
jgi:hypothetical protein